MNEQNNRTIALLIDAENVSHEYLGYLESELTILGRVVIKRCYGDFKKDTMKNWNAEFINEHSLETVHQYSYTSEKNASDIRLAIDAMDILYVKKIDTICIMSSDSDFTGLAMRLKESNIFIIGAGEEKTPKSFKKVCDQFITLNKKQIKSNNENKTPEKVTNKDDKKEEILDWVEKLLESYGSGMDSGELAKKIRHMYPDFSWYDYGVKKFPKFFPADRFTIHQNKDHSNITIALK